MHTVPNLISDALPFSQSLLSVECPERNSLNETWNAHSVSTIRCNILLASCMCLFSALEFFDTDCVTVCQRALQVSQCKTLIDLQLLAGDWVAAREAKRFQKVNARYASCIAGVLRSYLRARAAISAWCVRMVCRHQRLYIDGACMGRRQFVRSPLAHRADVPQTLHDMDVKLRVLSTVSLALALHCCIVLQGVSHRSVHM